MSRLAVMLLVVTAAAVCGRAQPEGVRQGLVVDASTGQPIARARVVIASAEGAVDELPAVATGVDGRFTVLHVPDGKQYVSVTRSGYMPFRMPLAGQEQLLIQLHPLSVIHGSVRDPQACRLLERWCGWRRTG